VNELATTIPAYVRAQFPSTHRFALLGLLTAAQLVAVFVSRPAEPQARGALAAPLAAMAIALLLLVPSAYFPDDGVGGRLLYQGAAFYAVFSAVALRHARLPYLVFGVTAALVIVHAAIEAGVVRRWEYAHAQMHGVVNEVHRVDRELQGEEFALVLVPQTMQRVPFARNAQAGLMMAPLFPPATSRHLLVQTYDEVPQMAQKIREGVVPSLRQYTVFEYLEGKRAPAGPPVYPSRVLCWDAKRMALVPLPASSAAANPDAWVQDVQSALRSSTCAFRSEA
jgi:hypothetical protein